MLAVGRPLYVVVANHTGELSLVVVQRVLLQAHARTLESWAEMALVAATRTALTIWVVIGPAEWLPVRPVP